MSDASKVFYWDRWANGWLMGKFPALTEWGIPHAVSTRFGPDVQQVAVATMAAGLHVAEPLGLPNVAFANQVHGAQVQVARQPGNVGDADALCTNQGGLALLGKSADCPLILLADPERGAVGFAHASWRSTVAGIIPALIRQMVQHLGCRPKHMLACICPSIGPECYEVGSEVQQMAVTGIGPHAQVFFRLGKRRAHFDLWAANSDALMRCGLPQQNIYVAGICTLCHNDLLPSYRKEGAAAGRFMAIIGLGNTLEKDEKNN